MTRSAAAALALALGAAGSAAAQDEAAALLRQGRELYERLELERAIPLFRRVVSPDWPHPVDDGQRAEAYRYLGAALAVAGKRDSAVLAFRAALERDPFTDLDAAQFTPAQLAVFAAARRLTFAAAVRLGPERRVDPRTERVRFTVVTTHAAALRGTIRPVADTAGVIVLFEGANDGVRELRWNGLGRGGRLAAPGRYEMLVIGSSRLMSQADSASVFLDVAHEAEPLEDSLPPLAAGDLSPERFDGRQGTLDLATALGVAAGALFIREAVASERLGAGNEARWIAGASVAVGVAAFLHRRTHRERPGSVAVNAARRAERNAANEAIRQRNAERQGRTILLVTPAAGVGTPP